MQILNRNNMIVKVSLKKVFVASMLILILLIWYIGSRNQDSFFYLLTFFALAPVGWLLRKEETIILLVGFILQDKLTNAIDIFYRIYLT